MIYFSCEYLISLNQIHAHTCYQLHRGNESPKLPENKRISWKYWDFPSPKTQFSPYKIRFSSMAFRFLQRLSTFFNGFLIFLNGFLIFLNNFPLSDKSEKIYLRREVYERSLFELCIFCHLLSHSRFELRNTRYNTQHTPVVHLCSQQCAISKSKLKYNLSRI